MADLITVPEFETRSGRTLTDAQKTQVGALIADASAMVRDLAEDELETVPASIVPVVVSMVRRGFDNPHGFTGETTAGGYSYTGASGVGLFATRDERRTIRKAVGKAGVGALNLEGYLPSSRAEAVYFSHGDLVAE